MNKPQYYNTLRPYQVLEHPLVQYSVCCEYAHISRYKGLRQVVHYFDDPIQRFIALENPNPFETNIEVQYYVVPNNRENRLDLIAYELLGSAQYAWVIAYFNQISDGFSIRPGQRLVVPKSVTDLFKPGELLASVNPMALNLGEE